MFGLGTQELIIILVLVLMIFGAGKLPQVGSALGKGLRNLKDGIKDVTEENKEDEEEHKPPPLEKKKEDPSDGPPPK